MVNEFNELQRSEISYRTKTNNPTTYLGDYASGNQVVKVPGVFQYLEESRKQSNTGDEDQRVLLAIEMEAHSLPMQQNTPVVLVGWS